jgi:hypothetical protein
MALGKIGTNQIDTAATPTVASATVAGDLTVDTNTLHVDSTNNGVGIGTTSPSATHKLTLDNPSNYGGIQLKQSGTQIGQIIQEGGTGSIYIDADSAGSGGSLILRTNGGTERTRLDSSGNLLVGSTSAVNVASGTTDGVTLKPNNVEISRDGGTPLLMRRRSSNGEMVAFRRDTTFVGSISVTTSSTAYNTSSDHRLKENVTDITGATDRLKQLNPVRFNFIADADTTVDGFLAHEVQDVVPEAITGTKDGMRDEEYEVTPAVLGEEGNVVTKAVMGTRSVPDYQGIDQSKLVPLLVKTIQELETRIAALEAN